MCQWGAVDNGTGREKGKKYMKKEINVSCEEGRCDVGAPFPACSFDHHHLFLSSGSENGKELSGGPAFILQAEKLQTANLRLAQLLTDVSERLTTCGPRRKRTFAKK